MTFNKGFSIVRSRIAVHNLTKTGSQLVGEAINRFETRIYNSMVDTPIPDEVTKVQKLSDEVIAWLFELERLYTIQNEADEVITD